MQTGQIPNWMAGNGTPPTPGDSQGETSTTQQNGGSNIPQGNATIPQVQVEATGFQFTMPQPNTRDTVQGSRPTNLPTQSSSGIPQQVPLSPQNTLDSDLEIAATSGDLQRVQQLISSGGNANKGSLHRACMHGHKVIVAFLIQKGANTEMKLANGETALHTCAYYGQLELLSYLIDTCGANMWERIKDGKTSLMLAVVQNYRNLVEELLNRGANVDDNDIYGTTSLILAAQRGNKEICELLLKFRAKVDSRDIRARTALHFAASGGHPHILSLLIQHGAALNVTNVIHETPLHYAAFHGKNDCVMYLLSKGADSTISSNSGGTPLQLAMARNFPEIVQILQRARN